MKMWVGMNEVLVVYVTGTGCTADVAERTAKPDPAGHHAVLVGSGIRAGMPRFRHWAAIDTWSEKVAGQLPA